MNCSMFRKSLVAYVDELLDEEERTAFRSHLASCEDCRQWALGEDPSLLFALPARFTDDDQRVEACADAVVNRIRQRRLERRLRGRRQPWLMAAAAALVLIAGGTAWQLAPDLVSPPPRAEADPDATLETEQSPPTIEVEMSDGDIRVYQFAADDADTAVYYVVNPSMEL